MDIKRTREVCDNLFTKRTTLMTRWQEIAENFYPERADFTLRRPIGDQFADNLMTSYPLMCRRDLGDQIGTMLRPTAKSWFHMVPKDESRNTNDAKRWMEWAEGIQRRAMFDRVSRFERATKEGDHDFAAFGQTVLSVRLNKNADALLYRCWHLRDVVWMEDEEGEISLIARKWKPYAHELQKLFGDKNSISLQQEADKDPFMEIECYHIILKSELYDGDAKGRPYFSLYYDIKHDKLLEEVPVWNKEYIIPRWQTVSGSQYAFSPATIAALPDARLIQSMVYTILEAGQMATTPPLIATKDAIRSDIGLYPGGITWVDADYDEKLGEALRPLTQDLRGMPIGLEMQQDTRNMLAQAFYLNKLTLPQRAPEMTAYEIGQRIQEYIRGALPIFAPMESDYNGQLCDMTFELLLRNGAFGSPYSMPASLRGAEINFRFESPLHDALEEIKGQKFGQMKSIIAEAAALDPSIAALPNIEVTVRDVLEGIQVPAKWMHDEIGFADIKKAQQAAQQSQQILAALEQGSKVAANAGVAQKNMADAQAAGVQ